MGSFRSKGRNHGLNRRRGKASAERQSFPRLESLEERRLLSGSNDSTLTPIWKPTSTDLFDAQNGPMANLGVGLVSVYKAYVQDGHNTALLASQFPNDYIQNGMVGIQLKMLYGGDFNAFVSQVTEAGMHVTASSSYYDLVQGYAPPDALPTIAQLSQTQSGSVSMKPVVSAANYQGNAYNEAETSMFADVARTQFGVDGTGVTVGVLSDSVSQYKGGLSDSYNTGDLNPNSPVTVVQDDTLTTPAPTDEGRAMLENIHDIAPGAGLAFATAEGGDLAFANNINALASKANSNIIVDDVTYPDEPFFQPGVISQAIDNVTSKGVTYYSSAGNEANDGYLSTFRAATASIPNIGSGTFMNFDPNGGTNTQLTVTTDGPNAQITFQYDQPFQTQQPAGSPGRVTSTVYFWVLNSDGSVLVGSNAQSNNVATQEPMQIVTIPNAGSYKVVIQVVSGANPGHVEFFNINENVDMAVDQTYGSAGGTYYPSSVGHHEDANSVGVGATPWWAPSPYLGQTPLANEQFSSYGPGLQVFDAQGVALSSPKTILGPTLTAPDGGNTSFFFPGEVIDTTNPPNPGEPSTTTNLSQANLPSFFGTSAAAPNAAAVGALMKQLVPSATPAQIKSSMITSASQHPMNGQAPGSWNVQSGYGFLNAIDALNAIDQLRVATTTPANGSTLTTAPSVIQVTFNKPVDFKTVTPADLTFLSAPKGVTVKVGTPIAVDDPNSPTVVAFPISFVRTGGVLANGAYSFSIQDPTNGTAVVAKDGKVLVGTGKISFTLQDTSNPDVINTAINGRTVSITFNKAIDPSTVNLNNILVLRQGTPNTPWPPTPSTIGNYIDLNNDPRTTISYDPLTFTVTLDYSKLPQTEMPSDSYAIVVLSPTTAGAKGVTDVVGNPLNGYFTGSFPSTAFNGNPYDFIQNLGFKALQAPTITTFTMTPATDSGIASDQNTNQSQPSFIGQIYVPFPGSVSGDQVLVQFGGLHGGSTTLTVGGTTQPGASTGRGYSGSYDIVTTTDSTGRFTVSAPSALPEGFQSAVAVVIGQPDQPPLPGLSSVATDSFRIDKTSPEITSASFTQGGAPLPLPNAGQPNITNVSSLSSLSLAVVDPINPQSGAFATPSTVLLSALDPTTASNVSNYSLINLTTNTDESQFIRSASFTSTTVPQTSGVYTAYTGVINLTFAPGLPSGTYEFIAHTHELQYPGLADAAGNYLDDTPVAGEGTRDFILNLSIQNTPTYITDMAMEGTYSQDGSTAIGGPQSYYELPPASGTNTRDNVAAPPTTFVIDLSNPIPYTSSGYYNKDVLLVRSADNAVNASPDGDFGNLGQSGLGATGTGFTVVAGTTVTLYNYSISATGAISSTQVQPGGSGNRLVLQLPAGTTLPADYYRLYLPNQLEPNGTDTRIRDVYGNQLDGEFLGNPTSQGSTEFQPAPQNNVTLPMYQDEMSDGTFRQGAMSGDGVAGGAYMTGFAVVPYGNVVYARPDFVENPLLPNGAGLSDGSMTRPYPVLAPEGNPSASLASNPTHNPNLGLNNPAFFQPANFNQSYDYSGDGKFEQSALYAASQLAYKGPVIVVAEAGLPSRSPITGQVSQASFSLVSPAGNTSGAGGSASVPFDTTLVFQAGSALKLQGSSLFVQNQGSALQAQGTLANPVTFTSYNDATIGGATNGNPDTQPHPGDWGGIVFRNYDDAIASQQQRFAVDGILVGPNGAAAVSGAQDAMSILNFANVDYAGGAVPQGTSTFYSGITLYNSRPMITNALVAKTGGAGGTEGAIAGDMNSLREDDTARGPLIRQVTTVGNSINGFYLMAQSNGIIEPTNAVPYADNPASLGGSQNYTLAIPLPVVITAQVFVGQQLLENTGGETDWVTNRLYIQPGSMIKLNKGSGIDLLNPGASLNVGTRSYINGYDADNNYSPSSPGFVAPGANDPTVMFTSIFDDTASTPFVPAINVTGETTTPTLGPSMWGSVGIITGGIVVINDATFQYGGGSLNTQNFTIDSQSVLSFITFQSTFQEGPNFDDTAGTRAYITNNNFYHNFDSAMQIEPNGLLAGDPLRPLKSGHPFFRGNVMQGNGIDGLSVITNRIYYLDPANNMQYIGPREAIAAGGGYDNQTVNAVWDATDLTYVLRGTLILGGAYEFNFNSTTGTFVTPAPLPNQNAFGAEPSPIVTLTIQSALPGTPLANGQTVPSPGQSVIIKMLSDETPFGKGSLATPGANTQQVQNAGAGFVVGVDDGVDPPGNSPLVDPGAYSELRILGIPGNQTTGQQRVPVIITSLRDGSVGTTVRGVSMYNILENDPVYQQVVNTNTATNALNTPIAGDGGTIYIGGNSMHSYSATDPFDGSVISNADISYMTRIEVQGGGIIDSSNSGTNGTGPGSPGAPTLSSTDWWDTLNGYLSPTTQLNTPMSLTIVGSNLADFSDAGVFVHPDSVNSLYRDWTNFTGTGGGPFQAPGPPVARGSLAGEPVFLYMYNDTISNSGEGVHINSQTGNDTNGDSVFLATILNCTFYNDGFGIHTIAPAHTGNPDNSYASVDVLAMNNIFANSASVAVSFEGQNAFSQLQYNLFNGNTTNIVSTTNDGDFGGNTGASFGDPQFVGPVGNNLPATSQNFELKSTSPAIDAGRSEIGPLAQGNALFPGIIYPTSGTNLTGTRINPANIPPQDVPGKADVFGEFGSFFFSLNQIFLGLYDSRQIVTLPGSGSFNFPDQWQPVLAGTAGSYTGPSSNANTYNYQPYNGVRDILGYIRVPDPSVAGVGYGSNPFTDIGAYEYVNLHPPEVTSVTATMTSSTSSTGTTTIPFYGVGNQAGSNTTPQTITIGFNEPIDPATLTGDTVLLQEMGVAPGTTAKTISLSGKLSYDSGTNSLIINLGAAGLTLPTDEYRLELVGSGAPVIQNTQGVALDGENLSNSNDPNTGTQQALPSGNGYPGGNFYDTFIINTTPPVVVKGSVQMSPTSDSNIVGDDITTSATPTFTGTISEPNPTLVQLNGQTAILNIGIALKVNGTLQTFFDPSQLPASLASYAKYIRPYAGTGLTDTNGNFSVTVGVDAANTGLVTKTGGLADLFPIYNVGADGKLSPLPGDDSGYYVAQVVAQDQSGNRSTPTASDQVPFVVDDTAPTVQFISPTSGQVITSLANGQVTFTIQANKNIDLTKLNASSVKVVSAGPDGILGDADDVTVNIDPNSFQPTYLDQGSGGKGAEQISFTTTGTLTNGTYQVTLLNTGAGVVRDIAGNLMASPVSLNFAVDVPSLSTTLFVGRASYVTDPTATQGSRANPYPTITAAMTAAEAGDVVAVLPGVYTETVALKQFVRLYSASASSTGTTVFTTSTGDPLSTVIRAPQLGPGASSTSVITVSAFGLQSFSGLQTEISGFTIASPLLGDPALGQINPNAAALFVQNSDILIDRNYFADAGAGIDINTSGASAITPQVRDNVIAGNINGILINDLGSTSSAAAPVPIINNDFVFNTVGLQLNNSGSTPIQAYVASNIFWQNHDQTNNRFGSAINSATPNKVNLRNNLFQGDGSSDSMTADPTATNNLGNGFDPAALNSSTPDSQGNYVGNPAFAAPIDPRPGSDGPANLFVSSDFSLTAASAAIDNAWEQTAAKTDILGNSEAKIGGDGWGLAGYGPRDVGAFEFGGIGGNAVGGAFRIVTTSLVPVTGATYASGGTLVTATSPTTITVTFSGNVNHSSISATDLVLSGPADNPSAPVKATSLTWIDGHTVQFNLSGALSLPGSLNVSIAPNAIGSASGQGNLGYSDNVVLQIGNPPAHVNPTPYPTPSPVATTPAPTTPTTTPAPTLPVPVIPIAPAPAAAPVSPIRTKAARHHFRRRPHHHPAFRHAAHRHVAHSAKAHHRPAARHVVKIKAAHPRATVSLALSMAGHHHQHHHHHHKKSV